MAKRNKTYNLPEIERLTPDGFRYTTTDMWRKFCRHVVGIENDYFEKNGLIDNTIEEFIIELGEDDRDNDDNNDTHDDMIDKGDRQLRDEALQKLTEPTQTISTDLRRSLTEAFKVFDQHFYLLPLHNFCNFFVIEV